MVFIFFYIKLLQITAIYIDGSTRSIALHQIKAVLRSEERRVLYLHDEAQILRIPRI